MLTNGIAEREIVLSGIHLSYSMADMSDVYYGYYIMLHILVILTHKQVSISQLYSDSITRARHAFMEHSIQVANLSISLAVVYGASIEFLVSHEAACEITYRLPCRFYCNVLNNNISFLHKTKHSYAVCVPHQNRYDRYHGD